MHVLPLEGVEQDRVEQRAHTASDVRLARRRSLVFGPWGSSEAAMPIQEAHFSLSDGTGHQGGHQGVLLIGVDLGLGTKGHQGFLLIGVRSGLGNPTPMRRRPMVRTPW
jgi:hypothetical protein